MEANKMENPKLNETIEKLRNQNPNWPSQKYEWLAKRALGIMR